MNSLDAAQAFLNHTFPNCDAAFLAGSVVRGEETPASDLDIVVVTKGIRSPYEENLHAFGWPIDILFNSPETCRKFFQMDHKRRRPALSHMCAEGIILQDRDGLATQLQQEARQVIKQGPEPLSDEAIMYYRLDLTNLLEDFIHSEDQDEYLLTAQSIVLLSIDIVLGCHRQWSGEGKWLLRALRDYDPGLAQQCVAALQSYYKQGMKDDIVRVADQTLNEIGGWLKDGIRGKKILEEQPTAS